MKKILDRAFQVSDGLASLTHKKVLSLVKELQSEGVLTKKEGDRVVKGLSKVKKSIYDQVSGELKKALDKHLKNGKKPARVKKSKKRSRR